MSPKQWNGLHKHLLILLALTLILALFAGVATIMAQKPMDNPYNGDKCKDFCVPTMSWDSKPQDTGESRYVKVLVNKIKNTYINILQKRYKILHKLHMHCAHMKYCRNTGCSGSGNFDMDAGTYTTYTWLNTQLNR